MRKEYKQMMDQLSPREELVEQVLAQAGVGAELRQKRRRPMHKKKLILPWPPPWWCSPGRPWRWGASWAC